MSTLLVEITVDDLGRVQFYKNERAKHYRITLKPGALVRVTVPKRGSLLMAKAFLQTKRDWVLQQQAKKSKFKPLSVAAVERLRHEAKGYIPARVEVLAAAHGFDFNQIRIKNMTSRWGSCSSRKNLNFSLYLMGLESKYIDYVILHELCHTREMNHGPKFWALLESVCPGAKGLDRTMRDFGMTVG